MCYDNKKIIKYELSVLIWWLKLLNNGFYLTTILMCVLSNIIIDLYNDKKKIKRFLFL